MQKPFMMVCSPTALQAIVCRLHLTGLLFVLPETAWPLTTYGDVQPTDPYVLLGGPLELNCSINTKNIPPSCSTNATNIPTDCSIKVTNTSRNCSNNARNVAQNSGLYFQRGEVIIPQRYSQRLSPMAIQLRLPNISIEDEATTFYCRMNCTIGTPLIVGQQRILVFREPVSVKDIKCVIHDWASMKCTWALGVEYHHPEHVHVSLSWWIVGSVRNLQYECPNPTKTSCEWKEVDENFVQNSFNPYLRSYTMQVIVTNTQMNKSRSSRHFRIDTWKIVKPARPGKLMIKNITSSCINIAWTITKQRRKKRCFIELYTPLDKNGLVKMNMTTKNSEEQRKTVCGLYPSQSYKISVHCKSVEGGFPSDVTVARHKMPEDAPSAAPELSMGSYMETECSNSTVSCRRVTVYWKPPPKLNQNGEIVDYEMSMNTNNNGTERLNGSTHQGTRELILTSDVEVTVRAGTRRGWSGDSKPIIIKPKTAKPSPPGDVFVMGEEVSKRVTFHWTRPQKDWADVSNYTIFYCQAWIDTHTCKGDDAKVDGDLVWVSVSPDQTNFTHELQARPQGYMFGISADTPEYSSGLVWSTCTYYNDTPFRSSPKNFRFAGPKVDRSLTLEWDRFQCETPGPILFYTLRFCPVTDADTNNCTAPLQFVQIEARMSSYTLYDLKAGKTYKASLSASTATDSSPQTAFILAKAVEIAPEVPTGAIAGIAAGAILLCIVIVGFCYYRYMRTKGRDLKANSIIPPPPLSDIEWYESYTQGSDYHTVNSNQQCPILHLRNGSANATLTSDTERTNGSGQVVTLTKAKSNIRVDRGYDNSELKLPKMPGAIFQLEVNTSLSNLANCSTAGNEFTTGSIDLDKWAIEKDCLETGSTSAKLVNIAKKVPMNFKGLSSGLSNPNQNQNNSDSTDQSSHGRSSECNDWLHQSDVRPPPTTTDSVLTCDSSPERHSLLCSEQGIRLGRHLEDTTDSNGKANNVTCTGQPTSKLVNGYTTGGDDNTKIPYPKGTLNSNGHVSRKDEQQYIRLHSMAAPESYSRETVGPTRDCVSHAQDILQTELPSFFDSPVGPISQPADIPSVGNTVLHLTSGYVPHSSATL